MFPLWHLFYRSILFMTWDIAPHTQTFSPKNTTRWNNPHWIFILMAEIVEHNLCVFRSICLWRQKLLWDKLLLLIDLSSHTHPFRLTLYWRHWNSLNLSSCHWNWQAQSKVSFCLFVFLFILFCFAYSICKHANG